MEMLQQLGEPSGFYTPSQGGLFQITRLEPGTYTVVAYAMPDMTGRTSMTEEEQRQLYSQQMRFATSVVILEKDQKLELALSL